eukprot:2944659-Prymnesium_polylepis.1
MAAPASEMTSSCFGILAMRSSFSTRARSCTLRLLMGLLMGLWMALAALILPSGSRDVPAGWWPL